MTTNEIVKTARDKVLEPTEGIVSDETVLLYTNLAYRDVWKRVFTKHTILKATLVCANGVCTVPSNFGRAHGLGTDVSGNLYSEFSLVDFDRGDFEYGFTFDSTNILVNDKDILSLDLRYYAVPDDLTTTVNPSIDEFFHESIIDGVVYRLHENLQDEELSVFYKQKFMDNLQERIQVQSGYEEDNITGGEMFIYQKLI